MFDEARGRSSCHKIWKRFRLQEPWNVVFFMKRHYKLGCFFYRFECKHCIMWYKNSPITKSLYIHTNSNGFLLLYYFLHLWPSSSPIITQIHYPTDVFDSNDFDLSTILPPNPLHLPIEYDINSLFRNPMNKIDYICWKSHYLGMLHLHDLCNILDEPDPPHTLSSGDDNPTSKKMGQIWPTCVDFGSDRWCLSKQWFYTTTHQRSLVATWLIFITIV